jgi:cytochrome c biogenesis protein ResB
MKSLLKLLRSLKFTVFLVASLAVTFLLGVIIPQMSLLGSNMYGQWKIRNPTLVSILESIKFTDIYLSPVILVLWVLFFLNLVFIMSSRIPVTVRRCFRVVLPQNADSIRSGRHHEVMEGADLEGVEAVLKKRGYKVNGSQKSFFAVKNSLSPLATLLFHLSFFLLLIGGVMSFYTKFSGFSELAVGETFEGKYSSARKPKIGDVPSTSFTIEDIRPSYYRKTVPLGLDVALLTKSGRKTIGINRPYKEGALSFIIKGMDIAPLFIIRDSTGNELDGAYVKLKGLGGGENFFTMNGYDFRAVFYTDFRSRLKETAGEMPDVPQVLKQFPEMTSPVLQSAEVIDPAFHITAMQGLKTIRSGTIRKGESLEFDGHSILFADLTYWVKFYVVKEHGLGIIYSGFVLMVLALVIRFLFFRREIKGVIEDGNLYIGGSGEFYPALFGDEFKRLVGDIKNGT